MKSKKIMFPIHTIDIDEVGYHNINSNEQEKTITPNRIKQKIFTDGQITKTETLTPQPIEEYYINNKQSINEVDTLQKTTLQIENATYIIKVTIAKEWLTAGKLTGWFDTIKNIEVFFKNKRDTNALKEAKKTIAMFSRQINTETISNIIFANKLSNQKVEYEEIQKNTYQRKRTINHQKTSEQI